MTNHVPTLTTCQKLKDAGFPQGAYLWHYRWSDDEGAELGVAPLRVIDDVAKYGFKVERFYAAPILTEILEQLPDSIERDGLKAKLIMPSKYYFCYEEQTPGYPETWFSGEDDNPAEAAALLWLALREAHVPS